MSLSENDFAGLNATPRLGHSNSAGGRAGAPHFSMVLIRNSLPTTSLSGLFSYTCHSSQSSVWKSVETAVARQLAALHQFPQFIGVEDDTLRSILSDLLSSVFLEEGVVPPRRLSSEVRCRHRPVWFHTRKKIKETYCKVWIFDLYIFFE